MAAKGYGPFSMQCLVLADTRFLVCAAEVEGLGGALHGGFSCLWLKLVTKRKREKEQERYIEKYNHGGREREKVGQREKERHPFYQRFFTRNVIHTKVLEYCPVSLSAKIIIIIPVDRLKNTM